MKIASASNYNAGITDTKAMKNGSSASGEDISFMEQIGSFKSQLYKKVMNNDTEVKITIGNQEFSEKEWDDLMERVDKNIEEAKEALEDKKEKILEEAKEAHEDKKE
ncbi:MAG: hypothetical protein K6G87_00640 [Butyrivibrio sp.]|uniref:hypothetical protein n=1 Tax=Butyrivibrio sp. TaxID=28121 RepID=UPI0025E7235E|nr:hypothetical protein [Butyrivibrio sp.]MCR5769718.1 hypothetical protein [Butyrivibrio sp.]